MLLFHLIVCELRLWKVFVCRLRASLPYPRHSYDLYEPRHNESAGLVYHFYYGLHLLFSYHWPRLTRETFIGKDALRQTCW